MWTRRPAAAAAGAGDPLELSFSRTSTALAFAATLVVRTWGRNFCSENVGVIQLCPATLVDRALNLNLSGSKARGEAVTLTEGCVELLFSTTAGQADLGAALIP